MPSSERERLESGTDAEYLEGRQHTDDMAAAYERLRNNPKRRELAEWVQIASNIDGPDGTWCDYCTPRKLHHPTDHPEQPDVSACST